MNKRERKAKRRDIILAALDRELAGVRHNAEVHMPHESIPDEDMEGAWEEAQFYLSTRLEDVNDGAGDKEYIDGYIAERYGKVHTYGRGGATCAPESWVTTCGGNGYRVKDAEDLADERSLAWVTRLIADVRAWNEYVRAECSRGNMKEVLGDFLADRKAEREAAAAETARRLTI